MVYSLHPGLVPTGITRCTDKTVFPGVNYFWYIYTRLFCNTVEQGAQTTIYCSVDEKIANESGLYY
jgi:retinol dehydrogenase 12